MGGDSGLRLREDGVGVGLIGGREVGLIGEGVDRGLGRLGPMTLRPVEAMLMMSFRPELRDRS